MTRERLKRLEQRIKERTAKTAVNALRAGFWGKVDKDGPVPLHCPELGPCWVWTGGKDGYGYGRFKRGERLQGAHRVSYELAHGPIPDGVGYHGTCVLHRCDVRACVNPKHLSLGTQAENLQDMRLKGRGGRRPTEAELRERRRVA